jgi:hypothetical protein
MNAKAVNIGLMIVWVTLCVAMLARDWWMPAELREKISDERAYLVILVSIVFGLWNFARFFVAWQFPRPTGPSPEVEAYRRRIRAMSRGEPQVTDPQFNFDAPPPDDRPAGGAPT